MPGYGYGFYFDPLYLVFTVPALLLTMWAQWRVRSAYAQYSQLRNLNGLTGFDVAQVLLPRGNMSNVTVEGVGGELSDHYDPSTNVLRLSPAVGTQPSVASMCIAAHEIGHAEQDRDGYVWLKIRGNIVPIVNIGSSLGYVVFFAGLLMQVPFLAWIGITLFSGGLIFALVTLPVELDASNRAMRMLRENNCFASQQEQQAARDMLNAAALTYFAAAAQALMTLLYYIFMLLRASNNDRNRRY